MRTKVVLSFVFRSVMNIQQRHNSSISNSGSQDGLTQKTWSAFKTQYAKTYSGEAEEENKKKIFQESLEIIKNHNDLYEAGKSTYKMGINQFADMDYSEFMRMSGYRGGYGCGRHVGESSSFFNAGNIPLEKDWRKEGYVTEVKNQGECGSCWAFSATGSLEGQMMRKTGRLVSLSEQNLVDCSRVHGNEGCKGGMPRNAFEYIMENGGINTEAYYPYKAKEGYCRYSNEHIGATVDGYAVIKSGSEDALTKAIATVGPISAGIAATRNLLLYKSGVFNDPTSLEEKLNHSVLVVGYGSKDGQEYYIVKNSWGMHWGDEGYILIARNSKNMCGIASEAYYPVV